MSRRVSVHEVTGYGYQIIEGTGSVDVLHPNLEFVLADTPITIGCIEEVHHKVAISILDGTVTTEEWSNVPGFGTHTSSLPSQNQESLLDLHGEGFITKSEVKL